MLKKLSHHQSDIWLREQPFDFYGGGGSDIRLREQPFDFYGGGGKEGVFRVGYFFICK